tara:strand:- start:1137 stop:1949 length:813 start_codon:yes stop_codon:yes gene_type:complete
MRLIIKEELNSVLQEQQDSITKGDLEKSLWTFSKAANEPVLKIFNAIVNGLTAALESRDALAGISGQKTEQLRNSILKIVDYLKNIITETLDIIRDGAQEGEVSDLVGVVTKALKELPFGEIKEILTYRPIMMMIGEKTVKMFIETFVPWGKAVTTFGKMASFVFGAIKDTRDIINSTSKRNAFNTFADEILKADDNEETTTSFLQALNLDDGYAKIIKEKRIVDFIKKFLESISTQGDDYVITKANVNVAFQNYISSESGIQVAPQQNT